MTTYPSTTSSPTTSPRVPRQYTSERVVGILADRIRAGQYRAGDPLPTERELSGDLRVHRRSVRTAIEALVRDGFLSHRPNCRPTVSYVPPETPVREPGFSRISASNLIALIMWHGGGPLEHAGTSQQRIFWGMNQSLMKQGFHPVFLDLGEVVRPEAQIAVQEAEHLRYIRDQGFGGALFYPYAYRYNHDLVEEVSRSVPLVLLDRRISRVVTDFVGVENRGALAEVTRHLISQGHRRIAYLTRYEPIQSVQDRIQGYLDAMRGGEPGLSEIVLTIPPYYDERDWNVVDAVFRLPEGQRPTAAVCFTDYLAVSLAGRFEKLGLSVPHDVALTGFDDIVPVLPNGLGLTTVAQPYEEIGTAAADLMLLRLKTPLSPPKSIELPTRLIVRPSSVAQKS